MRMVYINGQRQLIVWTETITTFTADTKHNYGHLLVNNASRGSTSNVTVTYLHPKSTAQSPDLTSVCLSSLSHPILARDSGWPYTD